MTYNDEDEANKAAASSARSPSQEQLVPILGTACRNSSLRYWI
jgi:hypothetical protein|eukprot:COSAG06_NODE_248_length_19147_cov_105.719656_8_plen_43_part_00